jgi:hypothetical protein
MSCRSAVVRVLYLCLMPRALNYSFVDSSQLDQRCDRGVGGIFVGYGDCVDAVNEVGCPSKWVNFLKIR